MQNYNDLYPGNLAVINSLLEEIRTGSIVAFTGAGTSMPTLPSWASLIKKLLKEALESGLMDEQLHESLCKEPDDFLYVADEIYRCRGKKQTKIRICDIFKSLNSPTRSHEAIVASNFRKIITLNYDLGLEKAYASKFSEHLNPITSENQHETYLWVNSKETTLNSLILHWHGHINKSDSIILRNNDYIEFYEKGVENKNALRTIFSQEKVLLIGFGFSDLFIERQLNAVMQLLPTTNRHFAIIGVPEETKLNCPLERRKYAEKYKLDVVFYPVKKIGDGEDHEALQEILTSIKNEYPRQIQLNSAQTTDNKPQTSNNEDNISYKNSLYEVDGRKIYCEPNLRLHRLNNENDGINKINLRINVSDITTSDNNYTISSPHEFGLTNLGARIYSEVLLNGYKVIFRDARGLPNYAKKIHQESDFAKINQSESITIILDNFSPLEHQRLLKSLKNSFQKARFILLQRALPSDEVENEDFIDIIFQKLILQGLTRSDIRTVISSLSPRWDSDTTSAAVEKVYSDLIQLCIPLTPSNVIMYASVVCKDGSFVPVSRLHIIDRFVSEALQRPSDAYTESFNYINKVDLFSEFCYFLFEKKTLTSCYMIGIHFVAITKR